MNITVYSLPEPLNSDSVSLLTPLISLTVKLFVSALDVKVKFIFLSPVILSLSTVVEVIFIVGRTLISSYDQVNLLEVTFGLL